MHEGSHIKKSSYLTQRRQGKQDLRVLSLLLFLGLLFYTALSLLTAFHFTVMPEQFLIRLIVADILSLILWGASFLLLWKFKRSGKWLFFLTLLVSVFFDRHFVSLFSCQLEPALLKYLFVVLFFGKWGMVLYGARALACSKTIRSIWHIDYLCDEFLDGESDEFVQFQHDRQVQQLLRRTSCCLGLFLYLSMLCILLLLSFLRNQLVSVQEALLFIQQPLLSSCLFSALVWSIPMIVMYMKKQWGAYLLMVSIIAETMRILVLLPDYGAIIMHRNLPSEVKLFYFVLEGLRFLGLYLSCHKIISYSIKKENRQKEQVEEG